MRCVIIGAGPAGLYAAIRLRQLRPDATVEVYEQNAPDATFGFGVVLSDQAMDFLAADDPDTAALLEPHLHHWRDIVLQHRGERIVIDGIGFAGIGRLALLSLLQRRAASLGVHPHYTTRIEDPDAFADADLVIAADGLNSVVRKRRPDAFGERIDWLQNRFAWFGTERRFDALTQTFIDTPFGPMNAHHYSYAPDRSTFIVEMTADTFARGEFDTLDDTACRERCASLFAEALDGAPLIANASHWRQFPVLRCERWYHGNQALVGDALHTAHFSIGSGTRLALEDVNALMSALVQADWSTPAALPTWQSMREPVLTKLTKAARRSADWYEAFDTHMQQEPWPFALSYITRAGRIDRDRLAQLAPAFAREVDRRGLAPLAP